MHALAIFSDDGGGSAEDEMAVVDARPEVGKVDDALPLSCRFRLEFLDRVQWAQRAPRLARERVNVWLPRSGLGNWWSYPLEALRLAAAAGG